MKMNLAGYAAALLPLFTTATAAAPKVAGTGCCPLCK
jgi:hypothetical protein